MKLVDTNVLIYAVNQASEHQPRIFAYWNAALESGETIALP
jgi:predicted nucleic acid-binding protein